MIISDAHRYVFVEIPHTGTTAIAAELRRHYGGQPILRKHSHPNEFRRIASAAQRKYFLFAGIRNPLDEAVSVYLKYRNNHKNNYTDPAKWRVNGGWVSSQDLRRYRYIQATDASFADYLQKFFRPPYIRLNQWQWTRHRFDYVIRFEDLQTGFRTALERFGIEVKHALPLVNSTGDKAGFETYYTPAARQIALRSFAATMVHWNYSRPTGWVPTPTTRAWIFLHRLLGETARFAIDHSGITPDFAQTLGRFERRSEIRLPRNRDDQ